MIPAKVKKFFEGGDKEEEKVETLFTKGTGPPTVRRIGGTQ